MDKKKVALFMAVGIGAISVLGGITYFARKLWYGKSNSVQQIKTELEVPLTKETEIKTISKYEASEQNLAID